MLVSKKDKYFHLTLIKSKIKYVFFSTGDNRFTTDLVSDASETKGWDATKSHGKNIRSTSRPGY
jgi:hypothetical protein